MCPTVFMCVSINGADVMDRCQVNQDTAGQRVLKRQRRGSAFILRGTRVCMVLCKPGCDCSVGCLSRTRRASCVLFHPSSTDVLTASRSPAGKKSLTHVLNMTASKRLQVFTCPSSVSIGSSRFKRAATRYFHPGCFLSRGSNFDSVVEVTAGELSAEKETYHREDNKRPAQFRE